jgi:hypothetical protein
LTVARIANKKIFREGCGKVLLRSVCLMRKVAARVIMVLVRITLSRICEFNKVI